MDIAEKNKGSLDVVTHKNGDRNGVKFLSVARELIIFSFQIWSIYISKFRIFDAWNDYPHYNKI